MCNQCLKDARKYFVKSADILFKRIINAHLAEEDGADTDELFEIMNVIDILEMISQIKDPVQQHFAHVGFYQANQKMPAFTQDVINEVEDAA